MVMPSTHFTTLQPGTHLALAEGLSRHILERAGHTGTAVGEHVYVIGGRRGSRFYTDLLRLNLKEKQWEKVFNQLPFHPRANHIAVAVKHNIWLFGGADSKNVHSDVWVLDTTTLDWTQPQLSGQPELLGRCAAGADVAPDERDCILVCGGYGMRNPDTLEYDYFNDLVKIDTVRMRVEAVQTSGTPPNPRCFHSFTSLGSRCYLVGGRRIDEGNRREQDLVAVYDCTRVAWVDFVIKGQAPHPRSSHRAVSLGDRLILTGGITDDPSRHTDVDLIVTLRAGDDRAAVAQLEWSTEDQPPRCIQYDWPQGRGGHSCCLVKNQVLMLLGYTGHKHKVYLPEVLSFEVPLPSRPLKPPTYTGPGLVTPLTYFDEYNVSNMPLVEAARIQARQSRTGAGPSAKDRAKAIDLTADDHEKGRGHRHAGGKRGGASGSPARSPARDDVAVGSPGEGGWRLSKGANLAPHATLLPHMPGDRALADRALADSERAQKRQRTGRSPGPGRNEGVGAEGIRSGRGASPADVAASRSRALVDAPAAKAGGAGRCSPGRAPNQVERLQADVQRLQEELRRSRQSEAAAVEQARSLGSALEHQKAGFESEHNQLQAKLAEREAIVQSKSGELLSTQQAYGEAVRQAKDHQRQMDQVLQEKRELMAEAARLDQEHTLLSKRLNDTEVRTASAEAKVTSLEIELRRSGLEAQAAVEELRAKLRQTQASYEKIQQSYDTLTDCQAKSASRVAELQDQLAQQTREANEAKHKASQQLLELSAARDAEQRVAEAAKAEAKGLQGKNGALEHSLRRQNAVVDDLHRQLSLATSELTQTKASLHAAKQEIEALKAKHEQLVKAGVEIAQDLRGSLEQALHARDRSIVFEEENARMQMLEKQQQSRQQAEQRAHQILEQQRQLQQQQQQQSLQQTELQLPPFPMLPPQPLGSSHQASSVPCSGILGPPPQICGGRPSIAGNPGPSNAVL